MKKNLSNVYKIRSASSLQEKLPQEDVWMKVKEMKLLDDVLKVKGHPKSKNFKSETPYSELERTALIIELMNINTKRTVLKKKATFIQLLMESKKYHKVDMRLEANCFLSLRENRFEERLQTLLKPGGLIPKISLYRGKATLARNTRTNEYYAIANVRKLVNIHTNTYLDVPGKKLGVISKRALDKIISKKWPKDGLFDVVVERTLVPCPVLCRKYSDKETKVRLIIDNCRY